MEIRIIDINGKDLGKHNLPDQFDEEIRPDLIKRAVQVIESHERQPYGNDPDAGMKSSAKVSRRRRKYRGSYGQGISRVPRKVMSRRGTRINWVGAEAPGTVGGRRSHPPKAEKVLTKKINTKEKKKALRSAVSATMIPEIVKKRGHKIPDNYPFIIDNVIEKEKKTKNVVDILETIGFKEELERTSERKIRAGKGKMRNRKYKMKKGILMIVSGNCDLTKSARGIMGVEVLSVKKISTKSLAPGCIPGRATLFTQSAVSLIEEEGLFK